LVVSPEITAVRLRRLDRCVQRLRRLAGMGLAAYLGDEDAQALAERHFQIAVQCLLDMANHIVAEQGLGSPEGTEELLDCLAAAGVIPAPLHERVRGLAGFRDILVHDYLAVDHEIVHGLLGRLDDLVELARALDGYARRAGGSSS
jgi:uncharacterized protein YutE (UPF0331/DUF86 family)